MKFLGATNVKLVSEHPNPFFPQQKYHSPAVFWLVILTLSLVNQMVFSFKWQITLTSNVSWNLRTRSGLYIWSLSTVAMLKARVSYMT